MAKMSVETSPSMVAGELILIRPRRWTSAPIFRWAECICVFVCVGVESNKKITEGMLCLRTGRTSPRADCLAMENDIM